MTLRQYLILMGLGTGLCWFAWALIVLFIDPTAAGALGLSFFYLSLFLALVGTFSVFGLLMRRLWVRVDEVIFHHVKKAFRQSVILSMFIILILFLLSHHLLQWWNFFMLIGLLVLIETVIFSNRHHRNSDYV